MKPWASLVVTCLLGLGQVSQAQRMARAEEPEEVGLTSLGEAYFPNPEDFAFVPISNAGFEAPLQSNLALQWGGFEREESGGAPEGKVALVQQGDATASLVLNLPVTEVTPYLFTAWIRTQASSSGMVVVESAEISFGKHTPLAIPNTEGEWRRVGFFFRTAPGATSARVRLRFPGESRARVDHLRFRQAGEVEFTRAWRGWRHGYPERDLSGRAGDGERLTNFLAKLESPLLPGEPLRVIGIGSSYTNMLGNGERLVQWVREHFPEAPPIHYQMHVGSAVEFDFTRGWMRQHVIGRRPDLVILYSGGKAQDLEKLLADFRAHSTADVIVASLHLRERDGSVSEAIVNAPEWEAIREVAIRYGCEWVENRREWAAYLREHEQPIEWLLKDAVHQNDHGALVINENIVRHFQPTGGSTADRQGRERFLVFGDEFGDGDEGIIIGAGVEIAKGSGMTEHPLVIGGEEGGSIKVHFRGNRIDLVGRRTPGGGTLGGGDHPVRLDGRPLDEFPAFVTTLIVPGETNHRPERGLAADRAPHQVELGDPASLVPQTWTIRMTSDTGDYELVGSVTGPDGSANNGEDFTSDSGQVTVPTALWRRRLEKDGTHSNRTGDTFTWEVRRATTPEWSFRGEVAGETFRVTLADQLENGWHQLELQGQNAGGACEIVGFVIHEPPLGRATE